MLGVRPEDLTVAGSADLDHPCFEAVIEVVEQLGSEILLDMKVGENIMVASVEPTARVRMADKLCVAMRRSRLHVFEAQTEAAIQCRRLATFPLVRGFRSKPVTPSLATMT
jgi:multiple sugar transport system ATP-binding protein